MGEGTDPAQDAEQIWLGLTAAGIDHEDIVPSMCRRPVRVLACRWDLFCTEGERQAVSRCKRFWEIAGRNDDLGHRRE